MFLKLNMEIVEPVFISIISYSLLISILLLSHNAEKKEYIQKLKTILIMLIPIMISIVTVHCLYFGCKRYAFIHSYIIMFWCLSCIYIIFVNKLL